MLAPKPGDQGMTPFPKFGYLTPKPSNVGFPTFGVTNIYTAPSMDGAGVDLACSRLGHALPLCRLHLSYTGIFSIRPRLRAVEQHLCCCVNPPRIYAAGSPCPPLHPARRMHALVACPCSRVFGLTRCVLGRHPNDTQSSSPSSSACRGRRRGPASEIEVVRARLKVRNARSLPGPRAPPRLCVPYPRVP